jgi:hypothetical protein
MNILQPRFSFLLLVFNHHVKKWRTRLKSNSPFLLFFFFFHWMKKREIYKVLEDKWRQKDLVTSNILLSLIVTKNEMSSLIVILLENEKKILSVTKRYFHKIIKEWVSKVECEAKFCWVHM